MDPLALAIEPLIPGLRRFARAWTRDATLADDLVQDTLERAVASWRSRRGEVRPWLYAILHNLLVDHGRRVARRNGLVSVEVVEESALSEPATQEAGLHHDDLVRAMAQLPEEQRALLLLVSVEDLSYGEAASVLGVPVGTVMSRLSRGRDRLAAMLGSGERTRLRRVT